MAGRPPTYQSAEERPVTVSLRIPRGLYAEVQRYVAMRPRMTLTEFLLDSMRLKLETPTAPRDIVLSDDNTVIQELQEMVDTAVQNALILESAVLREELQALVAGAVRAELAKAQGAQAEERLEARAALREAIQTERLDIQHSTADGDDATTAALPVMPTADIRHYDNTVLREGTALVAADTGSATSQTPSPPASDVPPFNASTRYLGALCPQGHEWGTTGQSLRNLKGNYCISCNTESQRKKRQGASVGP